MYKRKENIEEERLEWESHPVSPFGKKDKKGGMFPPGSKHNKKSFHKQTKLGRKLSMRRKDTEFLVLESELFLLFSLLIFPYAVGFLVSYLLFYLYAGMPIMSFLEMQQLRLQIEFWGIGMYLFITVGVLWTVFKALVGFVEK